MMQQIIAPGELLCNESSGEWEYAWERGQQFSAGLVTGAEKKRAASAFSNKLNKTGQARRSDMSTATSKDTPIERLVLRWPIKIRREIRAWLGNCMCGHSGKLSKPAARRWRYLLNKLKAPRNPYLAEINRLRTAIEDTLRDNAHLADGDTCTLIKLKRALSPNSGISPK